MEMVLIRGLPGSGKSTKAKDLVQKGEIDFHFEADQFFTDGDGNYRFNPRDISLAHSDCQARVQKALEQGYSVVVSNTFTQFWEMLPYLQMAKDMHISVEVMEMLGEYGSIHDVPAVSIERMKARWEPYNRRY